MKKNKTKYYLTTILFVHFLVYFFKIDRDVFAFQEFHKQPNQTYSEQPLSKNVTYFSCCISSFSQNPKAEEARTCRNRIVAIWDSISLAHNSRVHHLLKTNHSHFRPEAKTISILFRKNIFHKSSEDEDLKYRFLV
jgi:hypothetical protein